MQRSSVVLPEPLGPMMVIVSPAATSRSIPRSTSFTPNRLCSATTRSSALMILLCVGRRPGDGRGPADDVAPIAAAAIYDAAGVAAAQSLPRVGDTQSAGRSTPTRGFGFGGVKKLG